METTLISKKLENIEQELHSLKTIVLGKSKKKIISLKGLLKGIQISEEDIQQSKKSLFPSS